MEVVLMTVCPTCMTSWPADSTTPSCTDPDHVHQDHEMHRHRSRVVLPNGTSVVAVSFDEGAAYDRDEQPDFGLYLDQKWNPPWPHEHFEWPDFGTPDDVAALRASLALLSERASAGEAVEIGCWGGHGRTGTALACLAILAGLPASAAVDWVRANYCGGAVETPAQEQFISDFGSA